MAMCSVIIYWFHEVLRIYHLLLFAKREKTQRWLSSHYVLLLHSTYCTVQRRPPNVEGASRKPDEATAAHFFLRACVLVSAASMRRLSKYHYYTYTTFGLRGYFRRSLWWWKNICRGRSRCIVVAASFFVITGWQQPHHTVVVQYSDTAMYYRTKERRKKGVSWCDVCV